MHLTTPWYDLCGHSRYFWGKRSRKIMPFYFPFFNWFVFIHLLGSNLIGWKNDWINIKESCKLPILVRKLLPPILQSPYTSFALSTTIWLPSDSAFWPWRVFAQWLLRAKLTSIWRCQPATHFGKKWYPWQKGVIKSYFIDRKWSSSQMSAA